MYVYVYVYIYIIYIIYILYIYYIYNIYIYIYLYYIYYIFIYIYIYIYIYYTIRYALSKNRWSLLSKLLHKNLPPPTSFSAQEYHNYIVIEVEIIRSNTF